MVPITDEEKRLPYAEFYYRDMAEIPAEKLAIWNAGPADGALATPIEDRNCFLDEEPMPLEAGYCVAPNGTGFVANSTFMPGVTAAMFDWWFAWHCLDSDLRYKIWDRDDHYYARAMQPEYVRDPKVPMNQKTWGVMHDILEDIGLGPDPLKLRFCKPSELGYDMAKTGQPGCSSMVCAVGMSQCPAVMTHKVMEKDGGVWFKSHFWVGYGLDENGELKKLVPEGESIPDFVPRALFGHNIKEFTNLAAILPELYERFGSDAL